MENIRGTYRPDIGFDENEQTGMYTNIISNEYGDILAITQGETIQECESKSRFISLAPKMLEMLIKFSYDFQDDDLEQLIKKATT